VGMVLLLCRGEVESFLVFFLGVWGVFLGCRIGGLDYLY